MTKSATRASTATEVGVATLIDSAQWLARPGSVGGAVPGAEIVIVDRASTVGHIGYPHLAGKRSDLVITGGVNVYPAEVENVLLAHEIVRDAAVFGVDDEESGEGAAAAVVLEHPSDAEVASVGLELLCRTRPAGFKAPREFLFVAALPRDVNGKLHRRALRVGFGTGDPA